MVGGVQCLFGMGDLRLRPDHRHRGTGAQAQRVLTETHWGGRRREERKRFRLQMNAFGECFSVCECVWLCVWLCVCACVCLFPAERDDQWESRGPGEGCVDWIVVSDQTRI